MLQYAILCILEFYFPGRFDVYILITSTNVLYRHIVIFKAAEASGCAKNRPWDHVIATMIRDIRYPSVPGPIAAYMVRALHIIIFIIKMCVTIRHPSGRRPGLPVDPTVALRGSVKVSDH